MNAPHQATRDLVTVHEPARALAAPVQVWRNAWRSRFLVSSLIKRDLRVRFRNSILGYFWSLVEPLMLTGVYYVLFTVVAHKPEPQYPLWVLIGVLVWQLFSKTLNSTVTCLTGNSGLIKQIYFPREIFPIASTGAHLIVTALSLLVAVPFLFYFGASPSVHVLLVPAGLLMTAALGMGLGLAVACANAVQHDVEHFTKFIGRAGMFLSPVLWTLDHIPPTRAGILDTLLYNPMVVPISMVRSGLQGLPLNDRLNSSDVMYSLVFCIGALIIGSIIFKRFEGEVVKHL